MWIFWKKPEQRRLEGAIIAILDGITALLASQKVLMSDAEELKAKVKAVSELATDIGSKLTQVIEKLEAAKEGGLSPEETSAVLAELTDAQTKLQAVEDREDTLLASSDAPAPAEPAPGGEGEQV